MRQLLTLAFLLPTIVSTAAEPLRIRALTYNIHHGEGVDRKLDLERIARVIRSVEPDIVALQEVDQKAERSSSVDQPAELARLTGTHVAFGANIPLQGGEYGNAVLSRWPIRRQENHKLPRFDDSEQRGVLEVEIGLPGDRPPLIVLATHLDHRPGNRERLASAETIAERVQRLGDRSALLMGDLNDVPESPVLARFTARWRRANKDVLPTIPVDKPSRQIDYVLFRPEGRWRAVETRVLEEAVASDHRALLAVLELSTTD